MGLQSGAQIELANPDKPEFKSTATVILSETVHPDALFCYYGIGAGALTAQGAYLTNAAQTGFNPNHHSSLEFNPLAGGQPSQDFIVKLRKV